MLLRQGGILLGLWYTLCWRSQFTGVRCLTIETCCKPRRRNCGDRNITVNSVQPSPVDTDLNPADGPMKEMMHSFMAIKRHVKPGENSGMVAYLVGPEAGIITGAQHTIDGGFGASSWQA